MACRYVADIAWPTPREAWRAEHDMRRACDCRTSTRTLDPGAMIPHCGITPGRVVGHPA